MTSQTLIQINSSSPSKPSTPTAMRTSNSATLAQPANLPYQANHQVELLHLQAEAEALLQELQILKQQRSTPAASL